MGKWRWRAERRCGDVEVYGGGGARGVCFVKIYSQNILYWKDIFEVTIKSVLFSAKFCTICAAARHVFSRRDSGEVVGARLACSNLSISGFISLATVHRGFALGTTWQASA